jgi:hypothetical protein
MSKKERDVLKKTQPELFEPNVARAMAGYLPPLSKDVLQGLSVNQLEERREQESRSLPQDFVNDRVFRITEDSIAAHGKTFIIDLGAGNWYISCEFLLHGHVVCMQNRKLDIIMRSWQTAIPRHCFQLLLVNQGGPTAFSMVVVDHMKLATCSFVQTNGPLQGIFTQARLNDFSAINQHLPQDNKKDSQPKHRGPCPLKETDVWLANFDNWATSSKAAIYDHIKQKSEDFEGFGTSHTNKVLFWAAIHPNELAVNVCTDTALRLRLRQGVQLFLDLLTSETYTSRVPAGKNTQLAFAVPNYTTRFQNEVVFKCHAHTKGMAKIPVALFQKYTDLNLLDPDLVARVERRGPDATQSRQVPIHAIRHGTATVYTAIAPHAAPDNEIMQKDRYLSREEAAKKAFDWRKARADLGPDAFQSNRAHRLAALHPKVGRPAKNATGKPGRRPERSHQEMDIMVTGYDANGDPNQYSEEDMAILTALNQEEGQLRLIVTAAGFDYDEMTSGIPPDETTIAIITEASAEAMGDGQTEQENERWGMGMTSDE